MTAAARYHVVGVTDTGPTDRPVLMSTGAQFHATFGTRTPASTAVYDDVDIYLREGGQEVWVSRVPDLAPATLTAALETAGPATTGAAVAVPAGTADTVGDLLAAHAHAHNKLALLTTGRDDTAEQAAAAAAALQGRPGTRATGLFWPWVTTGDGRHLPPTGYVAAARARAILAHGYWKHPDGPASTARALRALRFPNTAARNEELSENLISPLVTTTDGVALHGWWSLSADRANHPFLDTADLVNNLAADLAEAYAAVQPAGWDTVHRLKAEITALTKARLARLAKDGALAPSYDPDGRVADPGYVFTVTEPDVQPPDRNVVVVRVAVRPYTHAVLVGVRVFRVPILDPFPQESTP